MPAETLLQITFTFSLLITLCIYLTIFKLSKYRGPFVYHPWWLGLPPRVVWSLVFYQMVGIAGYITLMLRHISNPLDTGLSRSKWAMPFVICTLTTMWVVGALALHYRWNKLVLASTLTSTAFIALFLLIQTATVAIVDEWAIGGGLAFAIPTVIFNAVLWNSRLLTHVG
jgi:hypothetical protein